MDLELVLKGPGVVYQKETWEKVVWGKYVSANACPPPSPPQRSMAGNQLTFWEVIDSNLCYTLKVQSNRWVIFPAWPPSQEKTVPISPGSSFSWGLISTLVILALPNI